MGRFVALCFALVSALAVVVKADEVVFLDGRQLQGAVTWRDDKSLVIGEQTVQLRDIDTIFLAGEAPAVADQAVWCVDGSSIGYTALEAADRPDAILLKSPFGNMTLPLAAVRGWGTAVPTGGEGDRIVLVSGTYDGRIRGISNGQLQFESPELGALDLALSDILGLRVAGSHSPRRDLVLQVDADPRRAPMSLLPGAQPRLSADPMVQLAAWPTGLVLRIEGGRRSYLSDLKPTTVVEEGSFGRTWPYRTDRGLEGGPLLLEGNRFGKGLAVHSQCRLTWRLQGHYERFTATIGIADEVGFEGDCPVTLRGDGKILWHRDRITGRSVSELCSLDVTGVDVFELEVGFGARYDIGDRVIIGGASLIAVQ